MRRLTGQVSADTDDLTVFVDGGETYLGRLRALWADLHDHRVRVLDDLGTGPPAGSAQSFEDLLAEVERTTGYVAEVRNDLRVGVLVDLGIGPGSAAGMAADDGVYDATLAALALGVAPDVVIGVDLDDLVRVMDRQRQTDTPAGPIPPLDAEQVEALLTGRYRPDLADGMLAGTVGPPTDAVRDRVVAAMEAGHTPDEAGLDSAYFPDDYVEFHDLEARIAAVEARREVADGGWGWWDGDDEEIAAIDAELAELRTDRDDVRSGGGLSGDGSAGHLDAVAATSIATGGGRWEGGIYAGLYTELHDETISDGGIFGHGKGAFQDPDGSEVELEHIGSRVAADPATATAFFNGAGVERVAMLPTFVVGNDLDRSVLDDYGRGLAAASNATNADGEPALDFGGDDLVSRPLPETQDGVIWYNPVLLFSDGDFDEQFLADATETVLVFGHEGDPRGLHSHRGRDSVAGAGGGIVVTYNGGEDPRNVLLDRAAEDQAVVDLVIIGLDEGAHGSAPLLSPNEPLRPAYDRNVHRHWIDDLKDGLDGNATGHDHPTLDPAGYPPLGSEYPITSFLGTAAANGESSRRVILFVADNAADAAADGGGSGVGRDDGRVLRDPGTAAGVDLIMAAHATVMFRPAELRAVGIEGTDLNDGPGRNVGAEEWKAVHGEVLGWGRGQALALQADGLLDQAIVGAIDEDGVFHVERTRSFAQIAARAEAEAYEALFNYAAELDDEARSKNREANIAASVFFDLVGSVPHPAAAVAGATGGGLWAGFFDGYPAHNELEGYREVYEDVTQQPPIVGWVRLIAFKVLDDLLGADGLDQHFGVVELNVEGERRLVRLEREPGPPVTYSWFDADDGIWRELGKSGASIAELMEGVDGWPSGQILTLGSHYQDGWNGSLDSVPVAGATAESNVLRESRIDERVSEWVADG